MPGEWAGIIGMLYDHLVHSDQEFELLHQIDKDAVQYDLSLETAIGQTTAELARLTGASRGSVYIFNGTYFVPAFNTDIPVEELHQLEPEDLSLDDTDAKSLRFIQLDKQPRLRDCFPHASTIILLPLSQGNGQSFCLIILEYPDLVKGTLNMKDGGSRVFLETVQRQLSNTIALRDHARRSQRYAELSTSFFAYALNPTKCFDELAQQIPRFLPRFGPLEIVPDPDVQLLLYDAEEDILRIVGTTGKELRATRISVDHSFCGSLIRDPDMPFKVGDPQQDPYYKDYLGLHRGEPMRHELAVPIRWNGSIIGILNLESSKPGAFTIAHIESMLQITGPQGKPSIAPLIYALAQSILISNSQQRAMTMAFDKHLTHISKTLRHGTATLVSTIAGTLMYVEKALAENPEKALNHLRNVQLDFESLVEYIEKYREDIRGFSDYAGRPIRRLIKDAISLVRKDAERHDILVELLPGDELYAYCSLLFVQHIYDLLMNAIVWVEERIKSDSSERGMVKVSVCLEPEPPDGQERELNKRIRVTIWDNGQGASEEDLKWIGEPGFTSKQDRESHGFGVFGAKSYIEAIHGVWVPPKSVKGKYFEIAFLLDAVQEEHERHKTFVDRSNIATTG